MSSAVPADEVEKREMFYCPAYGFIRSFPEHKIAVDGSSHFLLHFHIPQMCTF